MKTFKIRCSQIGKIMKNSRSKKDLLSATAKTYAQDWLKEQIYGMGKEIDTKYTSKGHLVEDESIEVIKDYFFLEDHICKNEAYFENSFMTGTPDVFDAENMVIYDAKSSWDHMTFPLLFNNIPNQDYWWQMQGYMELTGCKEAHVCYVLCNTPEHLGASPMDYSSLPINLRIKTFQVDYDDQAITAIRARVNEVREYLNKYYSKWMSNE